MSVYSQNILNKDKPNNAWLKIFEFVKPGSRILDVGCSSGQLGVALRQEKGAYVVGLDIDEADIKLAKKNLDKALVLNIEEDSIEKLGTYDVVIMADVIEHLLDPVTALKKLKKVLKPKGELIFSIPNMANVTVRIELLKGRFEYRDWGLLDRTHLHYYDQYEVDRVFREAGYKVTQTDCTIRNIPTDILKKELKPLGIDVTDTLVEFLNRPEALIYQFVGRATPSAKPMPLKPETNSSLDSVTREIDNMVEQLRGKEQTIKGLRKQLQEQWARANTLDERLNAILTSKGWKMLEKMHTVKHKLKGSK